MKTILDLTQHHCMKTTAIISKIATPVSEMFAIKHFRYLKLYHDGSRALLSNRPDAISYMYEAGNYHYMWYDGDFPNFLESGWHYWKINHLLVRNKIQQRVEHEMLELLGICDGVTFIAHFKDAYEIFSFDTSDANIYRADKRLLLRFIFYFKQQARALIQQAEAEKIMVPTNLILTKEVPNEHKQKTLAYLNALHIKRYYLSGQYQNTYLTKKEASCVHWFFLGKSAKEIAKLEHCCAKTIEKHIENIKIKLNCRKLSELFQIILESGIVLSLQV